MFDVIIFVAGVLGGAVAAVAGFGIGSVLTPAMTLVSEARLAVAAVSIPHLIGSVIRYVEHRSHIEWRVLGHFGIASAVGGLLGALLNSRVSNTSLEAIFGLLLIFAGTSQLTGFASRWRLSGWLAEIGGIVSGIFGGLVGNQGGIRSAAMLGFDIDKQKFMATTTAVGLLVDGARVPVYLALNWSALLTLGRPILAAAAGVVVGTLGGRRLFARVPDERFRQVVGGLVLLLGLWMAGRSVL